jgi:hypothetical protein
MDEFKEGFDMMSDFWENADDRVVLRALGKERSAVCWGRGATDLGRRRPPRKLTLSPQFVLDRGDDDFASLSLGESDYDLASSD